MNVSRDTSRRPFFSLWVSAEIILAVEQHLTDVDAALSGHDLEARTDVDHIIADQNDFTYVSDLPVEFRSKAVLTRVIKYLTTDYDQSKFDRFEIRTENVVVANWYVSFEDPRAEGRL